MSPPEDIRDGIVPTELQRRGPGLTWLAAPILKAFGITRNGDGGPQCALTEVPRRCGRGSEAFAGEVIGRTGYCAVRYAGPD